MSKHPCRLLVVVGPTAVGKTELAVRFGQRFCGEVVSADSRQVYRYMDIGTAKPTPEQRAAVPHHLVDLLDPDQELTLARYLELAQEAIRRIAARGKLPMLVGGTGLYVRALLEGWTIPRVPPDPAFRAELYARAERQGVDVLHRELTRVDPEAAGRIDPRNVRRVIRALEVFHHTGRPISEQQRKNPPNYRLLQVGLTRSRPSLYARIDARVDRMIDQGLVDEVRWLVDHGYGYDLPAMSGLGYRQIGEYLCGEISLDEAIARIKRYTRRFVRQQYNWFRLNDPRIHWFDLDKVGETQILPLIEAFVRGEDR